MLIGMTGFAESNLSKGSVSIYCRMNTLNSRFLDLNLQMHPLFNQYEEDIVHYLRNNLKRGRVNLQLNFKETNRSALYYPKFDDLSYKEILSILKDVKGKNIEPPKLTLSDLLQLEIITYKEKEEVIYTIKELLFKLLEKSVKKLISSRKKEGKYIEKEIRKRVKNIYINVSKIEKDYPILLERLRSDWESRLKELSGINAAENFNIAREASQLVLKRDFNEELSRIKMQMKILEQTLDESPPIGSKLLFILQEASREINTLSNKALSENISHLAIRSKEELERIRELVQNVE